MEKIYTIKLQLYFGICFTYIKLFRIITLFVYPSQLAKERLIVGAGGE